ncbi:hypothetical protein D3C80_1465180 [compost metagenome]
MHAAIVLFSEKPIAVHVMERGDHPVAPLLIQRAHLFEMAEKVPIAEKSREDLLRQHRLTAGDDIRAIGKRRDRADGHYHVAHAQ